MKDYELKQEEIKKANASPCLPSIALAPLESNLG